MTNNRRFNQYRKLIGVLEQRPCPPDNMFLWILRVEKLIDAAERKLMPWRE